jgi:hypothetical protein
MGDAIAKVGTVNQPTKGKHSLHESTNENDLRLVDFAAGRQMAIKSKYFMHKRVRLQTWHFPDGHTFNRIDHCLTDARHYSDVVDVIVRRGANIDSEHMLVVINLRARISANGAVFSITRLGSNQVNQPQPNSLHCAKS